MLTLTQDNLTQLSELATMELPELRSLQQLFTRYYGLHSDEAALVDLEIRRRKRIKPELKLAIECIRRQAKILGKEVTRISEIRFKVSWLYSYDTLNLLTEDSKHEPNGVLTGKLAHRIAVERIERLEAEIKRLEGYIWAMQQYERVPHAVMDIIEEYGIKPELYRLELISRLKDIKGSMIPGTCKPIKTHKHKIIPLPTDGGPQIGSTLICKRCKNFKAGSYQVVYGGIGYNRYYLRKMLDLFQPEPGHRLFVVSYLGGYGHYLISVPESQCFEKALGYEFSRSNTGKTYYERVRDSYPFIKDKTQP